MTDLKEYVLEHLLGKDATIFGDFSLSSSKAYSSHMGSLSSNMVNVSLYKKE